MQQAFWSAPRARAAFRRGWWLSLPLVQRRTMGGGEGFGDVLDNVFSFGNYYLWYACVVYRGGRGRLVWDAAATFCLCFLSTGAVAAPTTTFGHTFQTVTQTIFWKTRRGRRVHETWDYNKNDRLHWRRRRWQRELFYVVHIYIYSSAAGAGARNTTESVWFLCVLHYAHAAVEGDGLEDKWKRWGKKMK